MAQVGELLAACRGPQAKTSRAPPAPRPAQDAEAPRGQACACSRPAAPAKPALSAREALSRLPASRSQRSAALGQRPSLGPGCFPSRNRNRAAGGCLSPRPVISASRTQGWALLFESRGSHADKHAEGVRHAHEGPSMDHGPFLAAVITDHPKLGGLGPRAFVILHSASQRRAHGAEVKVLRGCIPFWRFWGRTRFLAFHGC